MKNGVPYDVAMNMADEERIAHAVVFGEFEGNQFDWNAGQWKKKP